MPSVPRERRGCLEEGSASSEEGRICTTEASFGKVAMGPLSFDDYDYEDCFNSFNDNDEEFVQSDDNNTSHGIGHLNLRLSFKSPQEVRTVRD